MQMTGMLSSTFKNQLRQMVLGSARSAMLGAAMLGAASLLDPAIVGASPIAIQETDENASSETSDGQEKTIAFAYNEEDWENVIEDFVSQTGLTLYPYSEPPEGPFTYPDGARHTLKEGLDILNQNLQLKGYVLLRFNNQLILINTAEQGVPPGLIETVSAEDLDNRGSFDLVVTPFDVSGLEIDEIQSQIETLIDPQRGKITPVPAAKQLHVRENVRVLLTVRDVIEKAKAANEETFELVTLKYIPFETLMRILRPRFDLDDENRLDDGTLSVSLGSGETQIWITGAAAKVNRFKDFAQKLDKPEFAVTPKETEAYRTASYTPKSDAAIAKRIIEFQFEGRPDMRISLSEENGVIYVHGRDADHTRVEEILAQIDANGKQFAEIICSKKKVPPPF